MSRAGRAGFAVIVTVAACGGSDDSPIWLYKPTGMLQCGVPLTTQTRLDAEVSALRALGVSVSSSRCANDGGLGPTLCGEGNGDLFGVRVAPEFADAARQVGFRSADNYPDVVERACL
jgi:hypothetical protein